jgi:hypothetical protein
VPDFRLVGNGDDGIRLGFDHRTGDLLPLLVEDLGHADFSSNNTDHRSIKLLLVAAGREA